jgi:sugar phosphate isomerase/epimerase
MKLGVFTVVLSSMSLENAIIYLKDLGVQAIELGTGGFPGTAHLDAKKIYNKPEEIKKIKKLTEKYDMEISALSCHGNAVHPDKKIAAAYQEDFEKTIILAEKLGVNTVVTFSGCPGDHDNAKYPNWVTCPWPDDFLKILDYQWNTVLIPYWTKQ